MLALSDIFLLACRRERNCHDRRDGSSGQNL